MKSSRRGLRSAFSGQFDIAARYLHRYRNEVAIARQPEVIDLQRHGKVRHRVAQHQRLLQLTLPVAGRELLEFLAGKVARAVVELGAGVPADLHFDAPVASIGGGVRAVVAEDVVTGDILLRLHHAHRKIVVIQQRLAAGIGSQRVQRFLLALELALPGAHRTAGVQALSARRSLRGIAQRGGSHQAARIHRIEHHVVTDRRVDGGAQLRLVVDSGACHAAGEVDQRLFLRESAQHLHRRFQSRQLAIRVEDVELGVVRRVGGAGVGLAVVAYTAVRHPVVGGNQTSDRFGERIAVRREILQHVQVGGVYHDGHQVRRGDLALHELQRRLLRANLIGHGHACAVEEHHQEAAVLVLDLSGFGRRDGVGGFYRRRGRRRIRFRRSGSIGWRQGRIVQSLKFENFDLLRFAVFGDGEIGGLEAVEGRSVLVLHGNVDHH